MIFKPSMTIETLLRAREVVAAGAAEVVAGAVVVLEVVRVQQARYRD
jgi:hypothetical protein